MDIPRLTHVRVNVRDLDEAIGWYEQLLGVTAEGRSPVSLYETERGFIDTKLGRIFANPDPAVGLRDARALATTLARKHPGAAASLRGLEEMFTITRLGTIRQPGLHEQHPRSRA